MRPLGADAGEGDATGAIEHLLFSLGTELYGLDAAHVTETIDTREITPVPDVPPFVKGVMNLRGRAIPVMDLRLRFGIKERESDDQTRIIIASADGTIVGSSWASARWATGGRVPAGARRE